MSPVALLLALLAASCSAFTLAPAPARGAVVVSRVAEPTMMARAAPKKAAKKVVKKAAPKKAVKKAAPKPVAKKAAPKKAAPKKAAPKKAAPKPVAKKAPSVPRSKQRNSGATTSAFAPGKAYAKRGSSFSLQSMLGIKVQKNTQKKTVNSRDKPLFIIK